MHDDPQAGPTGFPWAYADPREFAELMGVDVKPRRLTRRTGTASSRWFGISDGPGPRKAVRRRGIFARLLAVADALAAAGGIGLLYAVAGQRLELGALLIIPVLIAVGKVVGLYDRDDVVMRRSTLDEAPELFELATLTALVGWIAQGTFSDGALPHAAVFAGWIGFFLLLVTLRTATRHLARRIAPEERVLFVGDQESYWRFRTKVDDDRDRIRVLGWVPFREDDVEPDALGSASDLPSLVGRHDVHRVVVVGSSDHREMLDVVRLMKLMGVQVSLLPLLLDVVGSSVELEDLRGLRLMGIRSFGLSVSSRFVKRATDIVGSAVGLFLLAPLFAAVAVAIRLDSPGPVFFRQTRVGRDGARFGIFKFRSMVEGADDLKDGLQHLNEAEAFFKITDDPRITRVGYWLRRTSIDELPQLINVLRGEMSLVGPRPLVQDDDQRVEGWHRQRLHLVPGMTGPWQVLGSSRIPLDEMVKLDYLYVANWSLWTDVKLMLRTVPVVLGLRGR